MRFGDQTRRFRPDHLPKRERPDGTPRLDTGDVSDRLRMGPVAEGVTLRGRIALGDGVRLKTLLDMADSRPATA